MRTHYTLLLTLILFASTVSAQSTILRVDANTANGAPYSTLAAAIAAANPGDTIQLVGATSGYTGATINKRVIIIGPGYFLGENPETQVNKAPARITSTIILNETSDSTIIMGLYFDTNARIEMYGSADNIIFKRNYFSANPAIYFNYSSNSLPHSNITIQQNYFANVPFDNYYDETNNNVLILNNYIGGSINGMTGTGMTIKNNVINVTGTSAFQSSTNAVSNSTIQNNVINIAGTTPVANMNASNAFANNISNTSVFGTADANQASVDLSTVFEVAPSTVDPAPFSTDGRWQLKTGSPAIGAGSAGEDIGMFGGLDPYILSGVPPIPAIYELLAPSSATQSGGLNITIKAKARQ